MLCLVVNYSMWSLRRVKTILGQNFASLEYGNCKKITESSNADSVCYSCKKSISRKKASSSHWGIFVSFNLLTRNMIMLQDIVNLLPFYYLSSSHLWEVQNKRKFQTFSSKSGRGHLWGVVPYKRFQGLQWKNWSLTRGGHNWTCNSIWLVKICWYN